MMLEECKYIAMMSYMQLRYAIRDLANNENETGIKHFARM